MRTIRTLIAVAICAVTLVATTTVASAGERPTTGALSVSCNDLGVYDVTLTVRSNYGSDTTLSDPLFEANDVDENELASGDLPAFEPTVLVNPGDQSLLEFQVPGATYELYVQWRVDDQSVNSTDLLLREPCTPTPTTEPPTTVPETTPSTEAPVAAAAVASPRFTG